MNSWLSTLEITLELLILARLNTAISVFALIQADEARWKAIAL